jgi:uncharacterized protein DUF4157
MGARTFDKRSAADPAGRNNAQAVRGFDGALQAPARFAPRPQLAPARIDPREREANVIAERVLHMTPPADARQHGMAGLRTAGRSDAAVAPPAARAGGVPLEAETRAFMEPRFGADFGRIRVHADPAAAKAAQEVDARAFTLGSHLVFDAGEYSPRTARGRGLIAHELVHAIQQGGAERWNAFPRGAASAVSAAGAAGLQRQPQQVLRIAFPRDQIRQIGNPDVNEIVDAFPPIIVNGQRFTISLTGSDGTARRFAIEITIVPGEPPVTSGDAARTALKSGGTGPGAQPVITMQIFQALPDPIRTLFHELLHVRLMIDQQLPEADRSETFDRYNQQFEMATDEALLRVTGALPLRDAVLKGIASVRIWFEQFVSGFKTPDAFGPARDIDFVQHFIEEKFVNREAGNARIPSGRGAAVTRPIANATIARRYAPAVIEQFRTVAAKQGLSSEVSAAEQRTSSSKVLSLDEIKTALIKALTDLYDALDKQLGEIQEFKTNPPGPAPPTAGDFYPRPLDIGGRPIPP